MDPVDDSQIARIPFRDPRTLTDEERERIRVQATKVDKLLADEERERKRDEEG